uniref:Amyloid beta A4 protein-binding family B member 1 n=1 Tax=Aceria tosichella TaxID=561515 RepID=A0A6G1SFK6_9ACAR
MSSRDKAQTPLLPATGAANTSRRPTTTAATTNKTVSSSSPSSSSQQANKQTSQQPVSSSKPATANKRTEKSAQSSSPFQSSSSSSYASLTSSRKNAATTKSMKNKTVIDIDQQQKRCRDKPLQARNRGNALGSSLFEKRKVSESRKSTTGTRDLNDESSSSSQEMTITSPQSDRSSSVNSPHQSSQGGEQHFAAVLEQETNIDRSLDHNNQATDDDESTTLLESGSSSSSGSDKRPAALVSQVSNYDNNNDDLSASQQKKATATTTASNLTSVPRNTKAKSGLPLPAGWEEHTDKEGVYYWHVPTGLIKRTRPSEDDLKQQMNQNEAIVLYHDDEEINQASSSSAAANNHRRPSRGSSEEDDYTLASGAALTLADETATLSDAISFLVYPLGCCEFDETQLMSANSTKAIQKCILRLANRPTEDPESMCWGMNSTQPILMRLLDDHIQFTDIRTQTLLRSQPIQTIKTWAVDDDNNFAFVVEDNAQIGTDNGGDESQLDSVDYALLTGPTFMCYVFSSMEDDDDMSVKVATKLNKAINQYRMQMSHRISKCTRLQQMVESKPLKQAKLIAANNRSSMDNDQTDADEDLDDQNGDGVASRDEVHGGDGDDDDDDDDDLAESSEMSLNVRYIGKVQVPRPMGIDVLNVAIDKCLADASKAQMNMLLNRDLASTSREQQNVTTTATSINHYAHHNAGGADDGPHLVEIGSPLIPAKIHVSPSSVIVENEQTGEIIVECRIRYLTFMGISRRDIRWFGFIMQNTTNQTFVAHCFECHPTAGHVCEAIQMSCSRMYEKIKKRQRMKEQVDDVTSILPKSSKIRDTLAKTLSKIKLTPII